MSKRGLTRRGLLQSALAATGLYGAARMGLRPWRTAHAGESAIEKPALLILYTRGGYNALFSSADSFVGNGAFGVTGNNITRVGQSDLYVDSSTLGTLSQNALGHMASIGVRHGLSGHPAAQKALFNDGNKSRPLMLAKAIGGDAAIRCAALGAMPPGEHRAIDGVSLQRIRDLSTTIAALGGTVAANAPSREMAAGGLAAAEGMSYSMIDANPLSSASLAEGYPASIAMLTQEAQTFDYAEMAQAYGIEANGAGTYPTRVQGIRMQLLGAELMIRAGTDVVFVQNAGWDSHGDRNGQEVRTKMQGGFIQALRAFTQRTLAMTGRNVVTTVFGDFSRSLPGSDHQANLTATVIGKYVKVGTTGRVNNRVGLPAGTPSIPGLWSYLGAALKTADTPFGQNPHNLIM